MRLHHLTLQAIAANLPASAAMMGNVVVWKPSDSQVFSAQNYYSKRVFLMELSM
jgi:hypothetical protein